MLALSGGNEINYLDGDAHIIAVPITGVNAT